MKMSPRRFAPILACVASLVWSAPLPAANSPAPEPKPPVAPPPRPLPPTRAPDGPGAPKFSVPGAKPGDTALRAAPGVNPPVDAEGDWLVGPDYVPAPETKEVAGVPQGRVVQFELDSADSKFYPGIGRDKFGTVDPANPLTLVVATHAAPYKRQISVYIPAQYVPGTAAPFLISHDGPKEAGKWDSTLVHTLDNLIAQKRVPVLIAIMIANGGGDAQGSQRGLEYDTMSGRFAEFIQAEVLPAVEAHCRVKLTDDPDGRAAMGGSSGAAAAFTMAWYHPEWYRRIVSYSGTYINQQWPYDPVTPGGAWEYHNRLVAAADPKPIRIWMHVSDGDLYNPNVLRDGMHDWVMANHRMAAVFRDKGYHYQYVFSLNSRHVDRKVREQTLPQALEWVWRGYPAAVPAAARTSALEVLTLATGERQVVHRAPGRMESPHFSPDGTALYYNHEGRIKRVALAAPASPVTIDTGPLVRCNNDHGLSPDGTQLVISDLTETGKSLMYVLPAGGGTPRRIAVADPAYWHGWSPDGGTLTYGAGREGNYDVYTVPVAGGPEKRLTTAPGNDNGPDYSADGRWIYFHSNRTGAMQVWRIHPDGSGEEQVTHDSNYNWFPHPSPDGKWILYLSTPTVPDTGHPSDTDYVLRLIPAGGGPARDIAKFFGGQGSLNVPCWSRDSTRVAFMSIDPVSQP